MNYRELLPENATRGDLAESFEIPASPMPYPASIPQTVSSNFYLAPGQLLLRGKVLSWPGRFVQVASRVDGLVAGLQNYKERGWLQFYFADMGMPSVRVLAEASDTPPAELHVFPEGVFPLCTCLANPLIRELRDERPMPGADSREVVPDPEHRASWVQSFDLPQTRNKPDVWRPAPGSFYGSVHSVYVGPGVIKREDGKIILTPPPLSQLGASVYPPNAYLVFGIDLEFPEARLEGRHHPIESPYEYGGWKIWSASVTAPANSFPVYRVATDGVGRVVELEDVRPAQAGMGEM